MYDFHPFADELATAINSADAHFFVNNVTFTAIDCSLGRMPPPPDSCKGQTPGSTVPGTFLEMWASEGRLLDAAEYEEFIREFLTDPLAVGPDTYGDAEPRLHAYATFHPQYRVSASILPSPRLSTVQAIATRIPVATPIGRTVVFFHAAFDGERWTIVGLGIPAGAFEAFLDPTSQAGVEQGASRIFEFWSRWE